MGGGVEVGIIRRGVDTGAGVAARGVAGGVPALHLLASQEGRILILVANFISSRCIILVL